ncbi:hypothetical protein MBAV_000796 [Candidatus Magnetobacterium bavaricum]|uniref:Uncharacterized protein n=1 Tax=Candidatus Magnetobacterium bavaricum TaxID=29290 RepID=A0A0F3GYG4_9BACT|nr:hypothetical protein MBAV_000796 [Candidatus Magnetobacterium bavaricum]
MLKECQQFFLCFFAKDVVIVDLGLVDEVCPFQRLWYGMEAVLIFDNVIVHIRAYKQGEDIKAFTD